MNTWIPCELHTHTQHSDGQFTVLELARAAKETGRESIAITDHNTLVPKEEIVEAMEETGIQIVRGLEWTTFYGHMVVLGMSHYVDWRNMGMYTIHEGLAKIHEAGGIAGIAHPYRVGSPLCTGCFWQYDIKDWHDIDYLEVWSQLFPPEKESNQRALALWTDLLNKGYRITGTYGLDWHAPYPEDAITAVTYLQVDRDKDSCYEEQVKVAIKNGRVVVTMGPLLLFFVKNNMTSQEWGIGDTVPLSSHEKLDVNISLDEHRGQDKWQQRNRPSYVALQSNLGLLTKQAIGIGEKHMNCTLNTQGLKWVRAELFGYMHDDVETMIGFTNPIYFSP